MKGSVCIDVPGRAPMSEVLLATFRCDAMVLALPVEVVLEVLGDQSLEPVPRAPGAVIGLISLRGRILAVTDVRARMGLPDGRQPDPAFYVVETGDELEVLRVDRAGEVLSVHPDQAIAVPDTTPAAIAAQLDGAFHVADQLVLVVDLKRILDAGED